MKFRYEAIDGYAKTVTYTEAEARKELRGHELAGTYAISHDGVSKLMPADKEACELFAILSGRWTPGPEDLAGSLYMEYATIATEDPDGTGDFINATDYLADMDAQCKAEMAAERHEPAWYPDREEELTRMLPDYCFSNGDGTGQVMPRMLPSGW